MARLKYKRYKIAMFSLALLPVHKRDLFTGDSRLVNCSIIKRVKASEMRNPLDDVVETKILRNTMMTAEMV